MDDHWAGITQTLVAFCDLSSCCQNNLVWIIDNTLILYLFIWNQIWQLSGFFMGRPLRSRDQVCKYFIHKHSYWTQCTFFYLSSNSFTQIYFADLCGKKLFVWLLTWSVVFSRITRIILGMSWLLTGWMVNEWCLRCCLQDTMILRQAL